MVKTLAGKGSRMIDNSGVFVNVDFVLALNVLVFFLYFSNFMALLPMCVAIRSLAIGQV